ncbi:acyl-CoA N-acyltransferase [Gonapodya prolifera JEL478]|uniref:Glucosamine 6-phosphate N-acetyltransferase n=1 Tax=Gonapodya prolifera (strain JEL478) TaxID=1344416 RepID=A0A139AJZ3_GONPJ|nr:acyl-CoA N-acyltransferase [Gonapodya prolifera JEL478]|eukprot:KXS17100.1 acyl-CoA N-acyltransferase [Gonapodya prolifera JEL478]
MAPRDDSLGDLFSRHLISKEVQASMVPGYLLRPLQPTDYEKGFLECLGHLTTVGEITKAQFMDRFAYLKQHNYEYFTIVIENVQTSRIAAAGTVMVERKFIHQNGLVGHIEDIVSHPDARGKNLGKAIIDALKHIGASVGCYKIILDCSEKNIPFYVKCGFSKQEYEMVRRSGSCLLLSVPPTHTRHVTDRSGAFLRATLPRSSEGRPALDMRICDAICAYWSHLHL